MSNTEKRLSDLSRRGFIGACAATVAALGATSLGCSENNVRMAETGELEEVEPEWKPVVCWAHCGGKCGLKAYVKDGTVLRLKTDDTHDDSFIHHQHRACLRGRSRKFDVFSKDRVRFPMKRKHWQPGGGDNVNGDLRGIDEWERISWDEALDMVADEITRIKETYGNRAILGSGQQPTNRTYVDYEMYIDFPDFFIKGLEFFNVLNLYGGQVSHYGTGSAGSFQNVPELVGFGTANAGGGIDMLNDRLDARNCEYAVMVGVNPAWSSDGTTLWANFVPMRDAGCKFYCIDPMHTDTAEVLDAEWVPIRPGTDIAFLMACAYVMITEDDPKSNPLIDWDVVNRCSIGFDAESMPEGADTERNFKDHILGIYDGCAKNPEWAEEICGVPAGKIREIAYVLGMENKTALLCGWGPGRCNDVDNLPQILMAVGCVLGGHFGKSGHMTGSSLRDTSASGGNALINPGWRKLPCVPDPVDDCIQDPLLWPAILEGRYVYNGLGQFLEGEEREIDVRCIYNYSLNMLSRTEDQIKGIEAYRKMDFVVTHALTFNPNAQYSDIVLPVCSPWELPPQLGMFTGREAAFLGDKVCDPLWESKSVTWIGRELLARWGIDPDLAYPYSDEQQSFYQISGTQIIEDDGKTFSPLVTFTAEDIAALGVEGEPQEGKISYRDALKQGVITVPRSESDNHGHIAYEAFRTAPEKNPLASESGKMELSCRRLEEQTSRAGWGVVSPVPEYVDDQKFGYKATFANYEAREKGPYPFQLFNPHYPRTAHAHFDNVLELREAFKRPLFISLEDAESLGIETGDTVLVENDYGRVVRQACVTNRIMPGVVGLPHGGWFEMDEQGNDLGGSGATLCGSVTGGTGVSGYNTQICSVTKVDGSPEDWERPVAMPECQKDEEE